MFIELIIFIIILVVLLDYIIKKERNDLTANIPGPKAYPIFGSALYLMKRNPNNLLQYSIKSRSEYGSLYKIWIFNQLVMVGSDPKDLEIIMSSPKYINKGSLYKLFSVWLGDGLLLSSGSKWHSRRKIITPTFHFKILEQFMEIFDQHSAILVEKLKPKADGKKLNIQPFICLEALDIIAETAMGTKVYAQTDPENEYVKAVAETLLIMAERVNHVFFRFEWIFEMFAKEKKERQNKAIKILHSFTENVIEKRRKTLEESIANGTHKSIEDDDIGTKKKMALLDVLLQATVNGKPLTNEDIREEVDTFMFEGHDTTTSAMCSALYHISRDEQIQNKLFEEIREVIGDDKDRSITLRELQDLKYLDSVIKETLRMYPSVAMFSRNITENVDLNNGKHVPAGTNFTISIYSMQRDENMFPDPSIFNPDRYLAESYDEKTHAFANIPFSAGPRNCIGQKFATYEIKSTISKILRHYELLPMEPDINVVLNLILRSNNGVHVGLKPRVY